MYSLIVKKNISFCNAVINMVMQIQLLLLLLYFVTEDFAEKPVLIDLKVGRFNCGL